MNQVSPIEEVGRSAPRQLPKNARQFTVADIRSIVGGHYGVTHADLIGQSRARRVCWPRQMAMAVARRVTELSMLDIGQGFGGRDHSTVSHACEAVEARCDRNPDQRADFEVLLAMLSPITRGEFFRQDTIYGRFTSVRGGALQ